MEPQLKSEVSENIRNPHFDDHLVVWRDAYSGRYEPPPTGYSQQFDLQWRLAVEGDPEYRDNPGASVGDEYIADRILEWTGVRPASDDQRFADSTMGVRVLDKPIDPGLIKGKSCIDIGCGLGRWTRVMQALGAASVVSVDISENAIKSVSQFNDQVYKVDLMQITEEHPEWRERFDFANLWGVAMCTHDPLKAFLSAAKTVGPGGCLYLMVYAPEGMHNSSIVKTQRTIFHGLTSVEERLAFVEHVQQRKWDWRYRLRDNLLNQAVRIYRRVLGRPPANKMGVLDMLEPYFNWVIPLEVIDAWVKKAGFRSFEVLIEEKKRVAHHVLAFR